MRRVLSCTIRHDGTVALLTKEQRAGRAAKRGAALKWMNINRRTDWSNSTEAGKNEKVFQILLKSGNADFWGWTSYQDMLENKGRRVQLHNAHEYMDELVCIREGRSIREEVDNGNSFRVWLASSIDIQGCDKLLPDPVQLLISGVRPLHVPSAIAPSTSNNQLSYSGLAFDPETPEAIHGT